MSIATKIYQNGLNRLNIMRRFRFWLTYRKDAFGSMEKHEKIAREVAAKLVLKKYNSVLDIGCGYGCFINRIAVLMDTAVGIDISKKALKVARHHAAGRENTKFINSDVIDWCSGKYDLIVCMGIIPYIPESKFPILRHNFKSMLSENGEVLIFEKVFASGSDYKRFMKMLDMDIKKTDIIIDGEAFEMFLLSKKNQ